MTTETITLTEAKKRFDDLMFEVHGLVTICGFSYEPAEAWEATDPVAYKEALYNWIDSEMQSDMFSVENF